MNEQLAFFEHFKTYNKGKRSFSHCWRVPRRSLGPSTCIIHKRFQSHMARLQRFVGRFGKTKKKIATVSQQDEATGITRSSGLRAAFLLKSLFVPQRGTLIENRRRGSPNRGSSPEKYGFILRLGNMCAVGWQLVSICPIDLRWLLRYAGKKDGSRNQDLKKNFSNQSQRC